MITFNHVIIERERERSFFLSFLFSVLDQDVKELPSSLFQRRWKDRTKVESSLVPSSWLNCPDSWRAPFASVLPLMPENLSLSLSLSRGDPASQNDTLSRMKIDNNCDSTHNAISSAFLVLRRAENDHFNGTFSSIRFCRNRSKPDVHAGWMKQFATSRRRSGRRM